MSEIRYVQVPKSDLIFTIRIPTTASENQLSAQDAIIIAFDNEVAALTASCDAWKQVAKKLYERNELMAKLIGRDADDEEAKDNFRQLMKKEALQ